MRLHRPRNRHLLTDLGVERRPGRRIDLDDLTGVRLKDEHLRRHRLRTEIVLDVDTASQLHRFVGDLLTDRHIEMPLRWASGPLGLTGLPLRPTLDMPIDPPAPQLFALAGNPHRIADPDQILFQLRVALRFFPRLGTGRCRGHEVVELLLALIQTSDPLPLLASQIRPAPVVTLLRIGLDVSDATDDASGIIDTGIAAFETHAAVDVLIL